MTAKKSNTGKTVASKSVKKGGDKAGEQPSTIRAALIPQPHGGALLPGGQKGQTPGPGRPASAIRDRLRRRVDDGITKVLDPVLEGRIAILLGFKDDEELADAFYTRHAEALASATDALRFTPWAELTPADRQPWLVAAMYVRQSHRDLKELKQEVSTAERIRAFEAAARYGLGEKNELLVVSPDVQTRLEKQADAILRICPQDVGLALVAELREVWK